MTNTNLTVTDNSFNDDVLQSATPSLNTLRRRSSFRRLVMFAKTLTSPSSYSSPVEE